ncbi:MAG: Rrf2 family transcriptional regulator [Bacillales bacterium]|jgi:Rrf2 family protein|nr:Rrf2 family transcriptional regulator [Bacillales bacterium]
MKISSRFSVAVHILSIISTQNEDICTSEFIAGSVNTNAVVIRRIMGMLKKAGYIQVRLGTGGASLQKRLVEITLLDVYRAVEVVDEGELFQIHENPNPNCPIGANIQATLEIILLQAQEAMENVLKNVTMNDLVEVLNKKIE